MYDVHHFIDWISKEDAKIVRKHCLKHCKDLYVVFKARKGYTSGTLFINSTSGTLPEKLKEIRIIKRVLKSWERVRLSRFISQKVYN